MRYVVVANFSNVMKEFNALNEATNYAKYCFKQFSNLEFHIFDRDYGYYIIVV